MNEDAVHAGERICVVADGMGGHRAGDVASRTAIEELSALEGPRSIGPAEIYASVNRANAAINAIGRQDAAAAGLGTTIAGIALVEIAGVEHHAVFNLGDSRVYRYADGVLTRATVDHSEVEEMILDGVLSATEAATAENRHVITRSLGTEMAPELDLWVLPVVPGASFLLCTDGLTTELDDAELQAVFDRTADPVTICDELLAAAIKHGGTDNITIALVEVELSASSEELTPVRTAPRSSLSGGVLDDL